MSGSDEVIPWHHYNRDFKDALLANDRETFTTLLNAALSGDNILRSDDMLIDGNENGRSYNCMGQSDMGLALIRAGRKWDVAQWVEDGIDAMNVMLTPYDEGGLRLRDEKSETTWFCGQTNREQDDKGGTLNKHLYATRTFLTAAKEMEALGMTDLAEEYRQAGEEGFLKLVKGKQGPQLRDFFVENDEGEYHLKAWVYYAASDANGKTPYYLGDDVKNATYHIFDMELIHVIGTRKLDEDFDFTLFHKKQVGDLSAFGAMLDVYETKLELGGLEVDTETEFGQFSAARYGNEDLLEDRVVDWFEPFLVGLRLEGTEGADTLEGSQVGETIFGRKEGDLLQGRAGGDTLRGGKGSDTLEGGRGDDRLVGGFGADTLKGQKGADTFRFEKAADSGTGAGRDTIEDFRPGKDLVDLRPIDADPEEAGNQAFKFIADVRFSGTPGELRVAKLGFKADLDGDGQADFEIALIGVTGLSAADILL